MNTNTLNNNTVSKDRYEYYTYSNECIPANQTHTKSDTVMTQNVQGLQKSAVDHLNDYYDKEKVTTNALNMAESIKNKTTEFKSKYLQDALEKKDPNARKPNIKNYMEVANELKSKGVDVDGSMIRANNTDCSGFIKMLYAENGKSLTPIMEAEEKKLSKLFGHNSKEFEKHHRGAELLSRASKPVCPEDVKPGDLVFFKGIEKATEIKDEVGNKKFDIRHTNYATHVGMVSRIEKDKEGNDIIYFIHKATNGGVVESTLNSQARDNQRIFYKDLNPTYGRVE